MDGTTHFAVPTEESKKKFHWILASSPVSLDLGKFHIRLAKHVDQSTGDIGTVYRGRVHWFGVKRNQELMKDELVAILDSPELVQRAKQLGAPDDYVPVLVMASPATPMARTNRGWLASVHTTLVTKEGEFTFQERVF